MKFKLGLIAMALFLTSCGGGGGSSSGGSSGNPIANDINKILFRAKKVDIRVSFYERQKHIFRERIGKGQSKTISLPPITANYRGWITSPEVKVGESFSYEICGAKNVWVGGGRGRCITRRKTRPNTETLDSSTTFYVD